MPRFKLLTALAVVAVALTAAASANAVEAPFSAHFKGKQTRNDPPCPGAVFCGSGAVDGYGPASYSIVPTSVGPLVGSCQSVTGVVNIALADATGTLTFAAAGNVCFPGNSHAASGQLHAFGNPFAINATLAVVGGTGAFAGATGSGSAVLKGAGAATKLTIEGVLDN